MTRANISYQMDDQIGHVEALTSTDFQVVSKCDKGVILARANVTGIAELSAARVRAGSPLIAGNALVISVNTVATAAISAAYYHNTGAFNSTVTWKSLLSVPN